MSFTAIQPLPQPALSSSSSSSSNQEGTQCCPICYESLTADDESAQPIQLAQCDHVFCKDCIKEWFLHIETTENMKISWFGVSDEVGHHVSNDGTHDRQQRQERQEEDGETVTFTSSNAGGNNSTDVQVSLHPQDDESFLPTCPHCRRTVTPGDVRTVLGRDLHIIHTVDDVDSSDYLGILSTARLTEESEQRAFTMAYLQEQDTRKCPDCQMWIIREYGCDAMKCLCGCRFCFKCGDESCNCRSEPRTFFDNVLGEEEEEHFLWDTDGEEWLEAVYVEYNPTTPEFRTSPLFSPVFGPNDGDYEDEYWYHTVEIASWRVVPLFVPRRGCGEDTYWYG